MSQSELMSFARDVCVGMCYLSSRGFVHRDLAARNVLLNSNGVSKVKGVREREREGGRLCCHCDHALCVFLEGL